MAPSPKNKHFGKFVIFPSIFLLSFAKYWFVFLYRKDTNLILKYLIFVKTLKKKIFVFMHMAKYLKEKNHIVFSYNKNSKYVLAFILALITILLKSRELGQYFKNFKKNYFVFF
jgi:hypothetical protein